MSKITTLYTCSGCDYQSPKWLGNCPACHEWGTFAEQKPSPTAVHSKRPYKAATPVSLDAIPETTTQRIVSGISEWDRVMGCGIVPGSFLALTGDPGIGKSTLLLQVCQTLSHKQRVFYFSTEESLQQIKQRACRIGYTDTATQFCDQTDLEAIVACIEQEKPAIVIIDSIQNCFLSSTTASPHSTTHLREAALRLMRVAKENTITILITSHITKDGTIAGPKTLEHIVDAVFYLQGEDRWNTRLLRAVKNRFGAVNELGFFAMEEHGLQEVENINKLLLADFTESPGSALVCVLEGSRPLILELQALTVESKLTMPQRVVSGIDHKQVVLIAAILQKYLKIKFNIHDIFFRISGGITTKTSSTDLGIALALLSSYFQQPLPPHTVALGELSLTGQIKPIAQITPFLREIKQFGIKHLMVSHTQRIEKAPCEVISFRNVYQLLGLFETKKQPVKNVPITDYTSP